MRSQIHFIKTWYFSCLNITPFLYHLHQIGNNDKLNNLHGNGRQKAEITKVLNFHLITRMIELQNEYDDT